MLTPKLGDAYWLETPLPGETSGGAHLSVALSPENFSQANGFTLIAPLRHASPNKYRIPVEKNEFLPAPTGRPMDQKRVIDLSQITGIANSALDSIAGTIAHRPLQVALSQIPRQFQIGSPPWRLRGQVWQTRNVEQIVLIANDAALGEARQAHHMCVPYAAGPVSAPIHMVSTDDRVVLIGTLTDLEQNILDSQLLLAFGLN